jgi:nitroreductase
MEALHFGPFVLPLRPGHGFPMSRYRLLREAVALGLPRVRVAEAQPGRRRRAGLPQRVPVALGRTWTMTDMNTPTPPAAITPESTAAVDAAIMSRRAVRAFLPTRVERATVEAILAVASRAPSGSNMQPWKVYVLMGEARAGLTRKILAAFDDDAERARHGEEYDYYPTEWFSPYLERRRKLGWDLYALCGIVKGDKARMHAQLGRNYRFFDAPVGLIFAIDRRLAKGSWLDYGTFLQSVMIAARGRGLHTCPQQAFTHFHRIIEEHLQMPAHEMVVCGMSMGYENPDAPENRLVSEREPVSGFARFLE